jgi:ribosome-binding factor A
MASNKLQRTNEDIQRVLSELLRSIKDPRVNQGLISITGVETTGDLRWCKVYLSVLGLANEKELMKGLKSASGWLRRELSHSLSLRYMPELVFQLDR